MNFTISDFEENCQKCNGTALVDHKYKDQKGIEHHYKMECVSCKKGKILNSSGHALLELLKKYFLDKEIQRLEDDIYYKIRDHTHD